MKKTKVEPLKESLTLISENSLKRLSQKAWKLAIMADSTLWRTDNCFSAYRWLLRHSELFIMQNLVSPLRSHQGRNFARNNDGVEGTGESKKQKSICNELNKGIKKFTLIRKDADLLCGVFSCEGRKTYENRRFNYIER